MSDHGLCMDMCVNGCKIRYCRVTVRKGVLYCPDSASSLNYKGSASLNGAINLRVCA